MTAKPSHSIDPTLLRRAVAAPWWGWVGAAGLSHAALRLIDGTDAAGTLQVLVPALFLAMAVIAWHLRRSDAQAPPRATAGIDVDIDSMRWREFETLIGRAFELQGFHVNEAGAAGSDASIDLLMRKERETYLVHCKTWRTQKVGVDTVQAVRAAMKARGAVGAFILSSGRFSRDAAVAASSFGIRAVDGPALQALLVLARAQLARAERTQVGEPVAPALAATETPAAPVAKTAARATPERAAASVQGLPCPVCAADMKKRLAKRGVNAGQYFWSCVRHPECKGTRRVRPD